jgi:coproporphyrinogen III oxidase-like Fe-S oxidoreductase
MSVHFHSTQRKKSLKKKGKEKLCCCWSIIHHTTWRISESTVAPSKIKKNIYSINSSKNHLPHCISLCPFCMCERYQALMDPKKKQRFFEISKSLILRQDLDRKVMNKLKVTL